MESPSFINIDEDERPIPHTLNIQSLRKKLQYFTLDTEERLLTQHQILQAFKKRSITAQNHDNACNTQESTLEDNEDTEFNNHSEYNTQVNTDPDALWGDGWIRRPKEINKIHDPRSTS